MTALVVPNPVTQYASPRLTDEPALPSILSRLRLETRGEHNAVERVLDLMDPKLTRDTYRLQLAQFYGFYSPLEAALQHRCALPDNSHNNYCSHGAQPAQLAALLPRLNKTTLLRQDLHHLGVSTEDLPLCHQLPLIQTPAQVLGCLYVMEGATLGGRLITQHIQATLGITPTTGGSFFEGYGNDTGKMWQAMRQLLVSGAGDTTTENAIVANAIATFACLRHWCDSANIHANYCTHNDTEVDQHA